jgi:hypothetical protein
VATPARLTTRLQALVGAFVADKARRCRRFERPWQLAMPGATTWLAVIGLAGLSTALAYIYFF